MYLLHCDTLTQVFVSSSRTCPIGHAQNAPSHNIPGLGLVQVALIGMQPPTKDCPIPGHGTTVIFVYNTYYIDETDICISINTIRKSRFMVIKCVAKKNRTRHTSMCYIYVHQQFFLTLKLTIKTYRKQTAG